MNFRRYSSTQFRYAMTYVLITAVVLFILNVYCSRKTQEMFFESKKASMVEKCLLASNEIANLEVINDSTIAECIARLGSLKVSRLIVTDPDGLVLHDSTGQLQDSFVLLPEVVSALDNNDVFSLQYHNGVIRSQAAAPIVFYGNLVGSVYMMEYDTSLGALVFSLQQTILQVTLVLELAVMIFSVIYSLTFSRRLQQVMSHMRVIQDGDYSQKVHMGGNDELTILGNEFNDLTEKLQTSEQKRRRFVSDASHELKTPLASIKLLSDSILQNDMDTETIREFVSDIGDEAERLNRMTAKLLSLTKVDGDLQADSEIIYMSPTIHRVVRMLSTIAEKGNITVETDLSGDAPILILEDDLYQIIFNLVENGIKYNVSGGKLTIQLMHDDENATLTVTDTGLGIPEEAIEHIFERFYRVDKARSRATGGSGLGLAIVRAIVERNRGEITVASQEGKGTVFCVSFPTFDTEVDKS
jgi:signal transduction histidine kinase